MAVQDVEVVAEMLVLDVVEVVVVAVDSAAQDVQDVVVAVELLVLDVRLHVDQDVDRDVQDAMEHVEHHAMGVEIVVELLVLDAQDAQTVLDAIHHAQILVLDVLGVRLDVDQDAQGVQEVVLLDVAHHVKAHAHQPVMQPAKDRRLEQLYKGGFNHD